jgi:hypothetical protein
MLEPTLDDAAARGLLSGIETIWLDRGYDSDVTRERLTARLIEDSVIAKKRKKGAAKDKNPQPLMACSGNGDLQTCLDPGAAIWSPRCQHQRPEWLFPTQTI